MRHLPSVLFSTIALISGVAFSTSAQAQSLPAWTYTLDSPNDSLGVDANGNIQPGGSIYEIFGMAVKDDIATDSIWFAISANLPVYGDNLANPFLVANGVSYPVPDSNIGWGDLFLDFSGTGNLVAASNTNQLFGIKFAINNDSSVPTLGVYSDVSLANVTTINAGYRNLASNNSTLENRSTELGQRRSASMGDLAWNDSYFSPYTSSGTLMPNVLGSGTKIGEVTLLDQENLVKAGLDPNIFNTATGEVFGFRIPKALLPAGEFIATLLTECINDGVSLVSQLATTPPPPPPQSYVCPVTDGQRNALMPTRVVDGVKIFEEAPSGSWFDPPATMGFQFVALGGTAFTGISGFPCAVVPDNGDIIETAFDILVKNEVGDYEIIGSYFPGQSVNFTKIYSSPITEFIIAGIDAQDWGYSPPEGVPLAFQLLLDQEKGKFTMQEFDTSNRSNQGNPKPGDLNQPPGYIGTRLEPPCLDGGQCGKAVPEPSTIAGLAFAVVGALKLRRDRRRK